MVDADGVGSARSNLGDARVQFTTATMQIRNNRLTGSLARGDEKILKECGYSDANEYWRDAISEEMTVPTFVMLLESHLLSPRRTADEFYGRAVLTSKLVEESLHDAWENGESWFVRVKGQNDDFATAKLRPREAALWLLARPLRKDQLPATLRAYLENEQPEGEKLDRARAVLVRPGVSTPPSDEKRGRRSGRSRERREEAMKILRTIYPPDGQPPKGDLQQVLHRVNSVLKTSNFSPIGKDTLRRALKDLKSPTQLTQMTQN